MSDDDDRVGRGRPPKRTQFKRGHSGNPKGRPRKQHRALIPSQTRKDVLRVMDMTVSMKTPQGDQLLTIAEATIYSLAMQAIKGKASFMKLWVQLQNEALRGNVEAHPEFSLLDTLLRYIEDKGFVPDKVTLSMLAALAKKSRRTF